MSAQELLDYLIELKYKNEYIICAFLFSDRPDYCTYFFKVIQDSKYAYLKQAITKDIVNKFIDNCSYDETVNLHQYFKYQRVFERACIRDYDYKRSLKYAKIKRIPIEQAIKEYQKNKRAINWEIDKYYLKRIYGNIDFKPKYRPKVKAYYINSNGVLKEIHKTKAYYLDGEILIDNSINK